MTTWNGRQCQLCGRFASHFYALGEDDGSSTYADERCLTPAERGYFRLPNPGDPRPAKCPFCGGEGELLVAGGGAANDDPYQDTIEPCIHCEGTGILKHPNERSS